MFQFFQNQDGQQPYATQNNLSCKSEDDNQSTSPKQNKTNNQSDTGCDIQKQNKKKIKKTYQSKIQKLNSDVKIDDTFFRSKLQNLSENLTISEQAKLTRMRKKVYIEMLEDKISNQEKTIEELKQKNQSLQTQQKDLISQLYQESKQMNRELDTAIQQKNTKNIHQLIDSMRLRLGTSGFSRVQTITKLFDQIVEVMMPFEIRYISHLSINHLDIFDEQRNTHDNFFDKFNLSEKFVKANLPMIQQQTKLYESYMTKLCQTMNCLIQLNEHNQVQIDYIRNGFGHDSVAQFLNDLYNKRGPNQSSSIFPLDSWQKIKYQYQEQQNKLMLEKIKRNTMEQNLEDFLNIS